MYSVICAILHTGNIEFDEKETTDHKGDACVITNMDLVNTGNFFPLNTLSTLIVTMFNFCTMILVQIQLGE